MSNKSLENVNTQFITALKSLNIEDTKQNKLIINLDLKKKIKTIISIQSLEERKSNIPKYLSNSKSYISLLSLFISLNTKTLFTIFVNNNGSDIVKKVIEEEEGDKVSISIDFIYKMIQTYNMEFDTRLLISKSVEYEKWNILEILDDLSILFEGDCVCKMLVYKIMYSNSEGREFIIDKILKSKYRRIYEFIKNNRVEEKIDKTESLKDKNLEKVICDILFIRNIQNKKVDLNLINKELKDDKRSGDVKNIDSNIKTTIDNKTNNIVHNDSVLYNKIEEEVKVEVPIKKITKKKVIFKKKESTVNYINIKWNKIISKGTLFESINLDYYKNKFCTEDFEYFIKVPETKKVIKEIKRDIIMDPKKSYALNIAFSRLKCDYKDLVYGILQQNSDLLNENLINQLLLYFPTDQEINNILSCSSTDKYVLFFKECGDCIQDIKNNLKSIKLDFLINNCNVENIQTFNIFFKDVLNSKYILEILGCVLYIGNIVNKGTTYGGAEGFSISDILSILNMRLNNKLDKMEKNTNKIGIMTNIKNIQTVKDLIKNKIPNNDINILIRNISYDNLINEIKEIINLKKEIIFPNKKYENMYKNYEEMLESAENIKKRFLLDKLNDEVIKLIIELCDIKEKHS